jgi:DNA polymerase III delta subunit
LVDLTPFGIGMGKEVAVALEDAGIVLNANTIPYDKSTPFRPSGLRMGTPALTTMGMKESEMKDVGMWIAKVVKDYKNKELQNILMERVEGKSIPESTVLIFWEGTDTFKTKDAKEFFARLQEEKYAQAFDVLEGAKLGGWILAEVAARGGKMAPQAVQYLVDHVRGDMWRLHSLIDQLVAYGTELSPALPCEGREVTMEDVRQFVSEKADDNIFNLVDAILGKQPKRVFAMIEEQYNKGEDSGYIFAMILRQCRILLELRDMFERDDAMTSEGMAKKLALHPFVVKKSLPLVKRYSRVALEQMFQDLLSIDIQTKTGQGDQSMLVDMFVGKMAIRN